MSDASQWFHDLRRSLSQLPLVGDFFGEPDGTIKWTKGDDDRPRIKWSVTPDNRLLFNGRDCTPLYPWTKEDLETRLQRLQSMIAAKQDPTVVDGIMVEEHVATGLWNEGTLTQEQLEGATNRNGGIAVRMGFDDQELDLVIRENTYYDSYQFLVSNHPKGYEVVRDIPDALAMIGDEGEEVY